MSSKEVKALKANREKLLKESQNAALEARKLTHKVKQWDKETADAAKALQALLKVHPWIEKEKSFFGKEGSDFDFAAKDMETCTARLKEVKADQVCLFINSSLQIADIFVTLKGSVVKED